jgi:hypothetical protein
MLWFIIGVYLLIAAALWIALLFACGTAWSEELKEAPWWATWLFHSSLIVCCLFWPILFAVFAIISIGNGNDD